MAIDRGAPPLAAHNQELVNERLRELSKSAGVPETLTVEWRGQPLNVQVIDMPVKDLFYNPNTHRVRAQRSYDLARDGQLEKDPWSAESQDYLHSLLKALPKNPSMPDPEFDVLMDSLRDFKQTDPGLITREGILVNGNTRRAALKELGVGQIRVGVLPESSTWDDISAVELSLQLRKDHRRDYSYINRLLAIDEQLTAGRLLADIARDFHIRQSTCEQDVWILECLNDLIDRSKVPAAQLRLMDFEDATEKLRELHRRYRKELSVNKEDADLLKETRLAAIALDFSKTDIRSIQPEFQARYLGGFTSDPITVKAEAAPGTVNIPGLGRTVRASGAKVAAARALTNTVLRAQAVTNASADLPMKQSVEAEKVIRLTRDAFSGAIDSAKMDERVRKRGLAAPDRIKDACLDLEQCITDLAMARGSNSLDEEAYDEAVQGLRGVLRKVAIESARSIKEPGDGVAWLLAAGADDLT